MTCGFCDCAWDIILGNVQSSTPLMEWIDKCKKSGCDEALWEYVDEKTGGLDLKVPPPEFHPNRPRTDEHRCRRQGPKKKLGPDKGAPKKTRAMRVPATVGAPAPDTEWVTDF